MEVKLFTHSLQGGWLPSFLEEESFKPDLVFVFGATNQLKNIQYYTDIRNAFPGAILFGCSTAGEIADVSVSDDSVTATAIRFKATKVSIAKVNINEVAGSFEAGVELTKRIDHKSLNHVFVLSDGLKVNASQLVEGLKFGLPSNTSITGGLSADGPRFIETFVIGNCEPESGTIAIVGFYGDRLKIGYGSVGGWDPFGPERLITCSQDNVLYEMDGRSALELYKTYLGEHADGLPATGLLFPLCLRTKERGIGVVRTVLSVNEKEQSMTFAGNLPEGSYVRLMKANFDRLIDGAVDAAKVTFQGGQSKSPTLAILISCVGRKMVLNQRVEEEVEGVKEILGENTVITGFYSYGEISPFARDKNCELHNQTMTITSFLED